MHCQKCGKALSMNQVTCPFCHTMIPKNQLSKQTEFRKEQEPDLRPKLISERYGMKSIEYEISKNKTNSHLIIILIICVVLVLIFLIAIFILF